MNCQSLNPVLKVGHRIENIPAAVSAVEQAAIASAPALQEEDS